MNNKQQRVAGYYNRDSVYYDQSRFGFGAGPYVDFVQHRIVDELLPPGVSTVLDVGAGTGRFSVPLALKGRRVLAAEPARGMIDVARERARGEKADVAFMLADASRLPLADSSFDVCICINVLVHMVRPEDALREMARILRPSGVLVCNFNNLCSAYLPGGLLVNLRSKSLLAGVYSHWHSPWQMQALLRNAGFQIMTARGHFNVPPAWPAFGVPLLQLAHKIFERGPAVVLTPTIFFQAKRSA